MARHREIVFPFDIYNRVLSQCEVAPNLPEGAQHGRDRWVTTPDDVRDGFAFHLGLNCDWGSIPRVTEYQLTDLGLVVRLRNEGLKKAEVIESWPASEIPEDANFSGLRTGLNFQIEVSVITLRYMPRSGSPDVFAGSVVANRRFTFNTSGFLFPMEYANFAELGYPPNALWHIEFEDVESVDAPAEECVKVHLNEKVRPLFEATTREKRAACGAFTNVTGPLIFAEVAALAINQGLVSTDSSDGLGGAIVSTIGGGNHPVSEIFEWATNPTRHGAFQDYVLDRLSAAESIRNL